MGIGGGAWLRLGQEQVISSDVSIEESVSEEVEATTTGKSGGMIPRAMSASRRERLSPSCLRHN